MKITDLKLRELNGVMEHPDPFWEERLVRPQDIYPEFREQGADFSTSLGDGLYAMRSVFLEIHTDDGVVGLSGPCSRSEAFIIDHRAQAAASRAGSARHRANLGRDVSLDDPRSQGRDDDGDKRGGLRTVGSEGEGARSAGI